MIPFSNSLEGDFFKDRNCFKCPKYESESSKVENAGCKYAFYIDMGFITGEVPDYLFKDFDFK